ncbi:alpha/beta hydrolase [Aspergillus stella-maris]|uniref:alpha/beta hydrolase n=1 Tax=Aspergillus stella-maris TaxID=1810926 RepID=UPI003CCDACF9
MTLTLDPEFEKAVAPLRALLPVSPDFKPDDIDGRRRFANRIVAQLDVTNALPSDVEITKHTAISADNHAVPVYRFRPINVKSNAAQSRGSPAILHIHGGGMVMGDVASNKHGLAAQATSYGIQIFSVEYRLAPEARHPTLVEDCYAALLWLHSKSSSFQIDPVRIAILGESAGGGLAAGVALMARDQGLCPPLAKQILIYPMLDDRNTLPSKAVEPFAVWKTADNAAAWRAVLGDLAGTAGVSPYAAPARATNLSGLPPTYIDVGGLDIFRDEDMQYAMRLAQANVPVEFHLYPGVPHGFENVSVGISVTDRALENRRRAISNI